ncbi:MAG: RimK family alpha-L-glutamate ligase, partial [Zoogloea sp.]|nr:RimK family alpha-L-glutamate ligase [Zoogloea sp.]
GGKRDLALATQAQALAARRLYTLPAARQPAAIRLLVIKGPGDLMANTPLECMLESSDVALDMLYMLPGETLPAELPEHDLLFVAVGESDDNQPLLACLADALRGWPRPVVNRPECIAALSRDRVCELLGGLPGVDMPVSLRLPRATLEALADGRQAMAEVLPDGGFPVIVRPVGSHAGHGLERIQDAAGLADYLKGAAAATFYLSRYVDYSSTDGLFRKYRVALVEDGAYLCHLAISSHWMVHYLNAGMLESAAKRDEEAAAMADFGTDFARRHAPALAAIKAAAGLDYLAMDCAETREGKLLVFEIDSSMIVHALDPVDLFPYKKPQMEAVFDAFRGMLGRVLRSV